MAGSRAVNKVKAQSKKKAKKVAHLRKLQLGQTSKAEFGISTRQAKSLARLQAKEVESNRTIFQSTGQGTLLGSPESHIF